MAKYRDLLAHLNRILPGIARPIATPHIAHNVKTFCDKSRIWRKTLTFTPPTTTQHPDGVFVDVAKQGANRLLMEEAKMLDVTDVVIDNTRLVDDAYSRVARKGVVLHRNTPPTTMQCEVTLYPVENAQDIPDWLIDSWGKEIAWGIAADLALQPDQAWSNPNMAMVYEDRFKKGCNEALFESNNQRQGNRSVTHNFFGG